MKKHLLTFKMLVLSVSLGFVTTNFAQQQVDNSDFENWDNLGSNNEEPTNWSSFMTANCTLGGFICGIAQTQHVERSTDMHGGTYSARIWSSSTFGVVANGNLTVGRVNMGSTTATDPSNFNYTDIADGNFNQILTNKPDSIVAWVKFNSITSTSQARISASIHDSYNYHDPQDAASGTHLVAHAELNYGTTNGQWQRVSIPFNYTGPSTSAQYILITFTTNKTPGGGDANDEVFIDDLSLIYNTPKVSIAPVAVQNLIVNQTGSTLTATETGSAQHPLPATARQWKSSTTAGGPYTNISGQTGATYAPQFAAAGTYYVVCSSTIDGTDYTSNEVQVNVNTFSNSVSPTAVQNIVQNVAGTQLTVAESPTATSREWKWTTTSGSGYASFGTAETGTTYTPLFASVGTYYVVCQSTLAGQTVTSNEVQINVSAAVSNAVSIAPTGTQNLIENQSGTTLTETETPSAATSREWKWTTTSGSGYASFGTAETGTTYTPLFATAGTYYVVCVSDFGGGDIQTSNEVEIIVSAFTNSVSPATTQNLLENQSGTQLTVAESPTATSREWKWTTTSGSGYASFGTAETGTTYTPLFATAGTYYVVCESSLSGQTVTSNEVQINVTAPISDTVIISPDTTQHLLVNASGTTISATETPSAATSREWKWTTTSGSGYASFGTAETGTSYTPMFATVGTYYVVCQSDFSGNVVSSAEVTVIVTSTTGLQENGMENILVFGTAQQLKVDMSGSNLNNASIEVTGMDGKVIALQSLNSKQMNTIQINAATGIYFFTISNGNNILKGKVFIQ
jgi:plastocyanin